MHFFRGPPLGCVPRDQALRWGFAWTMLSRETLRGNSCEQIWVEGEFKLQ